VQSGYQYGRGHLQQVAATSAVDQDAARREDRFLHVDRHALAKPEWRRAAHLDAAPPRVWFSRSAQQTGKLLVRTTRIGAWRFELDEAIQHRGNMSHCVISANAGRLQLNVIQALMSGTCGPGIPAEIDSRSAANSVCLGACHGGTQVGFLRVATDRATFAYLADAIVHEQPLGRGIAKRMRETMRSHPDLHCDLSREVGFQVA